MQIYIQKNNQQHGPFDEQQLADLLKQGQVTLADTAWSAGMDQWVPLSLFYSRTQPPSLPPPIPEPLQVASDSKAPPAVPAKNCVSSVAMVIGIVVWLVGCVCWTGAMTAIQRGSSDFSQAFPGFVIGAICCGILRLKYFNFSWPGIHAMWAIAFAINRLKLLG